LLVFTLVGDLAYTNPSLIIGFYSIIAYEYHNDMMLGKEFKTVYQTELNLNRRKFRKNEGDIYVVMGLPSNVQYIIKS